MALFICCLVAHRDSSLNIPCVCVCCAHVFLMEWSENKLLTFTRNICTINSFFGQFLPVLHANIKYIKLLYKVFPHFSVARLRTANSRKLNFIK